MRRHSCPRRDGVTAALGSLLSIALATPAGCCRTRLPLPVVDHGRGDLTSTTSRSRRTPCRRPRPWITHVRGSEMLVLGADAGFLTPEEAGSAPSPSMLGGTTLAYPVGTFDAADGTYRSLGLVDLDAQVGAGSRVRILDFQVFADAPRAPAGRVRAFVSAATFVPRTGCRSMTVFEVLVDTSGQGAQSRGPDLVPAAVHRRDARDVRGAGPASVRWAHPVQGGCRDAAGCAGRDHRGLPGPRAAGRRAPRGQAPAVLGDRRHASRRLHDDHRPDCAIRRAWRRWCWMGRPRSSRRAMVRGEATSSSA